MVVSPAPPKMRPPFRPTRDSIVVCQPQTRKVVLIDFHEAAEAHGICREYDDQMAFDRPPAASSYCSQASHRRPKAGPHGGHVDERPRAGGKVAIPAVCKLALGPPTCCRIRAKCDFPHIEPGTARVT